MAKRIERTEASDSPTAAPPAQPAKGSGRSRSARQTADADTFAARREPSDEPPREEPMVETRAESAGSTHPEPSEEEIRQRAYQRYLERGGGRKDAHRGHHRFREVRGDRRSLLRDAVLPRARQGRRARVRAAPRSDPRIGPDWHREIHPPRRAAPRRGRSDSERDRPERD